MCREHGISSTTFYKWKAKYGGLDVSGARRLKALEDENAKLKKLFAEARLDNAILKDIAAKNGDARRQTGGLAHLCQNHGASQQQACHVIGADRTSVRSRSARPDDGELHGRLRELAAARRRFGYWRLGFC